MQERMFPAISMRQPVKVKVNVKVEKIQSPETSDAVALQ